jgi:hypothetical protein
VVVFFVITSVTRANTIFERILTASRNRYNMVDSKLGAVRTFSTVLAAKIISFFNNFLRELYVAAVVFHMCFQAQCGGEHDRTSTRSDVEVIPLRNDVDFLSVH